MSTSRVTRSGPPRPQRHRKPRSGGRALGALLSAALLCVTALVTATPSSAALSAVGPINPDTHFPTWYKDSNGLGLQLCLGVPLCLAGTDLLDVHAAGGDAEAFYFAADSTAGAFDLHLALEGAYAGPGADQEQVFQRTQVSAKAGGLPKNTTYTVTDPYGSYPCTTNDVGVIVANGCRIETTPVALDFNRALGGRIDPFLTPAPGAPAAPAGYIGDNATAVPVTGGLNDFNAFRVVGPGLTSTCTNADGTVVPSCVQSNKFILQGKLQPGASATLTPGSLDFGNTAAGGTKTLTYSSTGSDPVTVSSVVLGGADAADFGVTENCTTAATGVAAGSSCTVDVTYTPRAGVASSATLTLADTTTGSPRTVALKGSSLGKVGVDRTSVAFGNQKAGTTSPTEIVVVSNDGVAPLTVSGATLTGTGAAHYKLLSNGCTTLAPAGSCEIAVAFSPTSNGSKPAALALTTTGGNTSVALSGAGTTPTVTLSTTALAFADQNTGTTSAPKSVTLTNGGNASLFIDDVALTGTGSTSFKLGTGSCATVGNLAPGSSCNASATFAPTSTGAKSATLVITGDGAANNVALTGNGLTPPDNTAPSAPTGLTATAAGQTTVNLSWAAATDNVGVTGYRVFRDAAATPLATVTGTTYSDTTVAAGSTHSYRVAAIDAAGNESGLSAAASATTPTPATAPAAPTGVTATAGSASATVRWTAPGNGGSAITGYTIRTYAGTSTTPSTTTTPAEATATSALVSGLANGTSYKFDVIATNAVGSSQPSGQSAAVTPVAAATAPAAPTGVTATAGSASATVRWTAPGNGGSAITGYTIRTYAGTSTTPSTTTTPAGATATSALVSGLANGTSYKFDVIATNAVGSSQPSGQSAAVTPTATTTDTTPPTITSQTPAANATGVSRTNNITMTFSEPVTGVVACTTACSTSNVRIKNVTSGSTWIATVAYDAATRTVTLNPDATLNADNPYEISLNVSATGASTTRIADAAGNQLAPTTFQFRTAAATTTPTTPTTDTTAPTITARTPAVNATGASRTGNITVTFSEPVTGFDTTCTTVCTTSNFRIRNVASGSFWNATVTYNATTRVATLNPAATLNASAQYDILLNTTGTAATSTLIKDAAGNALAGTTWRFTTGTV